MLGKLLLAFILIPLAEFFLLVWVADQTSLGVAILLVIVTGIIGSLLARQQGVRAWRRFRASLAEGQLPAREIQDGLLIAFAAALLLTPGLITDTLGFLLLIPYTREAVRRAMAKRFALGFQIRSFQSGSGHYGAAPHHSGAAPDRSAGASDDAATVDPVRPTRIHRDDSIDAVGVRRVS